MPSPPQPAQRPAGARTAGPDDRNEQRFQLSGFNDHGGPDVPSAMPQWSHMIPPHHHLCHGGEGDITEGITESHGGQGGTGGTRICTQQVTRDSYGAGASLGHGERAGSALDVMCAAATEENLAAPRRMGRSTRQGQEIRPLISSPGYCFS